MQNYNEIKLKIKRNIYKYQIIEFYFNIQQRLIENENSNQIDDMKVSSIA